MQTKEQSSIQELSLPSGVARGESEEREQEDTPLGCGLFLDVPLGYAVQVYLWLFQGTRIKTCKH